MLIRHFKSQKKVINAKKKQKVFDFFIALIKGILTFFNQLPDIYCVCWFQDFCFLHYGKVYIVYNKQRVKFQKFI